jgi:hypothetical protein
MTKDEIYIGQTRRFASISYVVFVLMTYSQTHVLILVHAQSFMMRVSKEITNEVLVMSEWAMKKIY